MDMSRTDITLLVDRSGSMETIQSDAEGGVNAFIREQAAAPGQLLLSLVQFDDEYEFVHKGVPIGSVPHFRLVPRGGTALLDAMGRAIVETGERLASMPESDRPGLVIFVVVTDGQENSSREYTRARIREMVEHQQSVYCWHFTFLGANQDAFTEAEQMGFSPAAAANFAPDKVAHAWQHTHSKVFRMRAQADAGEDVDDAWLDSERTDMQ